MSRIDDLLIARLSELPEKPPEGAAQAEKRRYSEMMSNAIALALAAELREGRKMAETRPRQREEAGPSGAERRLAGGIGAKKVDVSWATEESGLLLAISVKTINFRDGRSGNYQKNLTNRRGDMLTEVLTLHRRFPYAIVAGFLFLDIGASRDGTPKRKSTFENAFPRLRLFTGRSDPAGRDEQFEKLFLVLIDANQSRLQLNCYEVDNPDEPVQLESALDDLVSLIAERNFDFYEAIDGKIERI